MANTAVTGTVGSMLSLAGRLSGWMRREEGRGRVGAFELEVMEGRQLLSVPTLNPIGPQIALGQGVTPAIAVLEDGSFVQSWVEVTAGAEGVWAVQVFKGELPGDAIEVSGVSSEVITGMPSIASGSDGGFMVVWTSEALGGEVSVTEIHGRAYDKAGTAVSAAFEIGSTTAGSASEPSITAIPEGGFAVTWHQTTPGAESGVYAQLFDKEGDATKQAFKVNTNSEDRPIALPQVQVGEDGELVVAWLVEDHGREQTEIHAQRLSPTGFKSGAEKVLTTQPAIFEEIGGHSPTFTFTIGPGGEMLFAWDQTTGGEPWNVYGRYFDSYLHPIGDAVRISGESDYSQYGPSAGFAPNGAAVVIWESARVEGEASGRVVLGAQMDSQTGEVVKWFDVSTELDGSHVDLMPRLATDELGGFTATWSGLNGPASMETPRVIIRTFAAVAAAEMVVTGDGEAIVNGSTETSHDNYTDFGFVDSDGGYHEHEFEILNDGNIDLEFGEFTVPEGFELVSTPGMLEPGETGTLRIALTGEAGIGVHTGVVSIPNNVEGMNPFTFTISGEVEERKTVDFTRSTPVADRTFIDEEGNTVVFTLTGPGLGSVSFNPRTHELLELYAEGTTRGSNLSINVSKTKGEGTGYTIIDEVYIAGSLNAFSAAKVDLYHDFTVEGTLASLVMRDVFGEEEHFIDIGGSINTRTDFTFGRINDLHLETNGWVGNFKAVEWVDLNDELDEFFTGSIISMNITGQAKTATQAFVAGDISVDIYTYNTGRPLGQPGVGAITVAGEVYECTWDLQGYVGSIWLGSADEAVIMCEDGFGSFTVWGEVTDSSLLAGYEDDDGGDNEDGFVGGKAGAITVGGWDGGEIGANSIASFNAVARAAKTGYAATQGEVIDMDIYAQAFDLAENALAIVSFKAAGFADHVDVKSLGNVGTVWLGKDAREFHVHLEDGGSLRSYTVMGESEESNLYVENGDIGTVQAAHWTGGMIEAMTLNSLIVTGRAKTATLAALAGDIDAEVILYGNLDKRNSNTLGTLRVAGMLHGVDGREKDIDITGSVGSVTAGSLERLAFSVHAYFGAPQVKIGSVTAGYTDYWDITAPGVAIGSITVAQWHDGHLYADKVGTLRVTGRGASPGKEALPADFFGLINLDGTITTKGNLLGSAVIGGAVTDTDWDINGSVGSVTVGSADDFDVEVHGNLASYTVNGQVRNQSTVEVHGVLNALRAVAWSGGAITAWKIGSVTMTGRAKSAGKEAVAGDFNGAAISVSGMGQAEGAVLLGSVTVAGWIGTSVISSAGNVGSIRSSAFIDSTVFVGVNSEFPVSQLPRHKADFANPTAKLQSFVVTGAGRPANVASFVNGCVAAGELTNVSIKLVENVTGEEAPAFGFGAATKIGSYRRLMMVDGVAQPVVVMNKTLPGLYDQDGLYMLSLAEVDLPPVG
jgi:hypothetical protein